MKKQLIAGLLWSLASLSIHLYGQSILDLTEVDEFGRHRSIASDNSSVVDINSSIHLKLDREALRIAANQSLGLPDRLDDLLGRSHTLLEISKRGAQLLPAVSQGLAAWRKAGSSKAQIERIRQTNAEILGILGDIEELSRKSSVFADALDIAVTGEKSPMEQYKAVFEACGREAIRINAEADAAIREEGVFVQLAAWYIDKNGNRPLHIPGFDAYADGDYWRFERLNLILSSEQLEQLEADRQLAAELNENGFGREIDRLKAEGRELLHQSSKSLSLCFDSLQVDLAQILSQTANGIPEIVEAKSVVTAAYSLANSLYLKYQNADLSLSSGPLSMVAEDAKLLATQVKAVLAVGAKLKNLRIPDEKLQAILEVVVRRLDRCEEDFLQVWEPLLDALKNQVEVFRGVQEVSSNMLAFGEKVRKVDLSQVSAETSISLLNAGKRSTGDRVALKIAVGKGAQVPIELEVRQFVIAKALPHVHLTVGMLFAQPFNKESTNLPGDFHFAPSYSMLFKPGSRRMGYKQFVDIGFGLNISTLDFDGDDIPEIGTAGVVSIFRDYLQGGAGYNFFTGTGYWFAMVRLPLPSVPIGVR